jgi:hypothetical protein
VEITAAQYADLKQQLDNLQDQLNNGIEECPTCGCFRLIWTEKQLNDARLRGEALAKTLKVE